jgi:hypothetical protein
VVESHVHSCICDDFRVRDLQADVDILLLGIGFKAGKDGDRVVRCFLGRHAALFAGEPDQICAACLGAHINAGAAGGFLSIMHFFAHEPVLHGRARAGHHRWRQAVLLHHRDLLSRWKVYTFEPDPLKDLASVFKRVV